jgi:hypothetical protein
MFFFEKEFSVREKYGESAKTLNRWRDEGQRLEIQNTGTGPKGPIEKLNRPDSVIRANRDLCPGGSTLRSG